MWRVGLCPYHGSPLITDIFENPVRIRPMPAPVFGAVYTFSAKKINEDILARKNKFTFLKKSIMPNTSASENS